MKLINTASPTFPSPSGDNTVLLDGDGNLPQLPCDWDLRTGRIIIVDEDTHEDDLLGYVASEWLK